MTRLNRSLLASSIAALVLTGCASTDTSDVSMLRAKLTEEEQRAATLQSTVGSLEDQVKSQQMEISERDAKLASMSGDAKMPMGNDLLPPGAKAGECYARVFVEPRYEKVTKRVLKSEASERVNVVPAKYGMANERVLVREASQQLKVIPAKYSWTTERVLVREASEKLVPVPATYRTESERVLVRPAYTTWKKGRGPIERIDSATGEIMCLVEIPAEYRTVKKRVQATAATTRKMVIPAQYKTVKKRLMSEAPKTITVDIPAEYKTVQVRKQLEPAREIRNAIPEQYQTVTETRLVTEGKLEWREILCETNTTPNVVAQIQRALRSAGHNPGPIDGVIGSQTMAAVRSYQRKNGLATGKLTIATLKKLRVL